MSKMMELIRTLIRDKGQASGLNPRMRQLKQIKEGKMSFIHRDTLPYMLLTSTWRKPHQCNKREGSRMVMLLHQHG